MNVSINLFYHFYQDLCSEHTKRESELGLEMA